MAEPEMTERTEILPMFPLGSVLFPDGVLPLHIFEIRYQQMLNHALETDRRFGVVLITRGSEVGGGDERSTCGTVATIDDYQRFDDGRAAVVATGTDRFEVVEWLEDDPYPQARVRLLDSELVRAADRVALDAARQRFDELIELGHRLGRIASVPESEWLSDTEQAVWQLAGRTPCTALDQYQILAAPSRVERLEHISGVLGDIYQDLELMGPIDPPQS